MDVHLKSDKGHNRTQINLFLVSLEHAIDKDNEVRVIDLFVDSLSLEDYGFKIEYVENGRPAYHPPDLLKLYIYGYLNKIRSARNMEEECKRNIVMIWETWAIRFMPSQWKMNSPIVPKKKIGNMAMANHFLFFVIKNAVNPIRYATLDGTQALNTNHSGRSFGYSGEL